MDAQLARLGSLISYERDPELDVFVRTDLSIIADKSVMAFGHKFDDMTAEEKEHHINKIQV